MELKLTDNELVIGNVFWIPCHSFVNEGIYQALAGILFMKPGMVPISIVSSRTQNFVGIEKTHAACMSSL